MELEFAYDTCKACMKIPGEAIIHSGRHFFGKLYVELCYYFDFLCERTFYKEAELFSLSLDILVMLSMQIMERRKKRNLYCT